MTTDHRAAIGPNDKSSLQCICEMLEQRFRSLCATATNAGFTLQQLGLWDRNYHASWKMSIKLTHEHDVLACVQYKPARL